MKAVIVMFAVLILLASWILGGIWFNWIYPKNYEYALRLADDASLPEVKAKYLTEYLECIREIKGPPAYIFMRKDLELDRQREILRGLVKRLNDITGIDPSNMAYQQGMEQLTGQEMDHQLERISGIFKSAKLRENPLLFFFICWVGWFGVIPVLIVIAKLDLF